VAVLERIIIADDAIDVSYRLYALRSLINGYVHHAKDDWGSTTPPKRLLALETRALKPLLAPERELFRFWFDSAHELLATDREIQRHPNLSLLMRGLQLPHISHEGVDIRVTDQESLRQFVDIGASIDPAMMLAVATANAPQATRRPLSSYMEALKILSILAARPSGSNRLHESWRQAVVIKQGVQRDGERYRDQLMASYIPLLLLPEFSVHTLATIDYWLRNELYTLNEILDLFERFGWRARDSVWPQFLAANARDVVARRGRFVVETLQAVSKLSAGERRSPSENNKAKRNAYLEFRQGRAPTTKGRISALASYNLLVLDAPHLWRNWHLLASSEPTSGVKNEPSYTEKGAQKIALRVNQLCNQAVRASTTISRDAPAAGLTGVNLILEATRSVGISQGRPRGRSR
jgi:hypothetical protein